MLLSFKIPFIDKIFEIVTNNKILEILFILSLIITVHFAFFTNIFIETESRFNNIFPKININDTEIPNKTEIFNSRKLFITDAKLILNIK